MEKFKYFNVFTFLHINSLFKMVSITLSIPKEVREQMKRFPEINWSGFVRKVVEEKTRQLAWKEELLKKLESPEEKELIDWSVKLQRASRKGRLEELKKRGLI